MGYRNPDVTPGDGQMFLMRIAREINRRNHGGRADSAVSKGEFSVRNAECSGCIFKSRAERRILVEDGRSTGIEKSIVEGQARWMIKVIIARIGRKRCPYQQLDLGIRECR
jgi:hypothetical protein